MPDLTKAHQWVEIKTDVRSVHKLYAALNAGPLWQVVNLEHDANLRKLCDALELILERSGYMTALEIQAIKFAASPVVVVNR